MFLQYSRTSATGIVSHSMCQTGWILTEDSHRDNIHGTTVDTGGAVNANVLYCGRTKHISHRSPRSSRSRRSLCCNALFVWVRCPGKQEVSRDHRRDHVCVFFCFFLNTEKSHAGVYKREREKCFI